MSDEIPYTDGKGLYLQREDYDYGNLKIRSPTNMPGMHEEYSCSGPHISGIFQRFLFGVWGLPYSSLYYLRTI